MSSNSPIFVEAEEYERVPHARRARSNEPLDWLREEERTKKIERGYQMIPYRDRGHYGASTQRVSADRLAVPVYAVSPRRPRAHSDTRQPYDRSALSRNYKTHEVRPAAQPYDHEAEPKPLSDSTLPLRGSTQSKNLAFERERPKVKIPPVVVQEHPPIIRTPDERQGRSPGRSPRSPSGQPQLQIKYYELQNKLSDISYTCLKYADVEAANPRDLTFEKISEQVKSIAFDLKAWHHVSNVENMPRFDVPEEAIEVADAASEMLDRLIDRATELEEACSEAKPGDLKFQELPKIENEDAIFDDSENDRIEQDPTESLSYIIQSGLHSIKLQIKSLKRLTRPLQEATPQAKEEVAAVASLVEEVVRYFGTDGASPVDKKFAGRRALQEARQAAAGRTVY